VAFLPWEKGKVPEEMLLEEGQQEIPAYPLETALLEQAFLLRLFLELHLAKLEVQAGEVQVVAILQEGSALRSRGELEEQ
jgi:hypothetical protein